jgi:hypothetical protein
VEERIFCKLVFPIGFKKVKDLFEVIGKLKIQDDFNPQNNPQTFYIQAFMKLYFKL